MGLKEIVGNQYKQLTLDAFGRTRSFGTTPSHIEVYQLWALKCASQVWSRWNQCVGSDLLEIKVQCSRHLLFEGQWFQAVAMRFQTVPAQLGSLWLQKSLAWLCV